MTDETPDDPEDLLQQSKEQRRHTTDAASDATSESNNEEDEANPTSLANAVADTYGDFDDGSAHPNLTIRDQDLAALVEGLEVTDELSTITRRANRQLDRDGVPSRGKAGLLKALVRLGLDEVAPDEVEAAKEGKRIHLTSQADQVDDF